MSAKLQEEREQSVRLPGLEVGSRSEPRYSPSVIFPLIASAAGIWELLAAPGPILFGLFQLWMLIDAIRRQEWMWVAFLVLIPGFSALWYFFHVFRGQSSSTSGFELPGAGHRKRIQELQAQIHHLDKPHHYSQLGDIYFQQGKLDKAEACYRSAMERDAEDIDTRAHLGQCFLRQKKPQEARLLLEGVVAENPKHDYGHSMMALAETLSAVGETDAAIAMWRRVTSNHAYPRAKVQLAQLLVGQGQAAQARSEIHEVIADDPHAPGFQRRRDRVWIKQAKKLARQLG